MLLPLLATGDKRRDMCLCVWSYLDFVCMFGVFSSPAVYFKSFRDCLYLEQIQICSDTRRHFDFFLCTWYHFEFLWSRGVLSKVVVYIESFRACFLCLSRAISSLFVCLGPFEICLSMCLFCIVCILKTNWLEFYVLYYTDENYQMNKCIYVHTYSVYYIYYIYYKAYIHKCTYIHVCIRKKLCVCLYVCM